MNAQQATSQIVLTCAAQLVTDIVMRLSRNGVSGTDAGQFITRSTVASGALHTVRTQLQKVS